MLLLSATRDGIEHYVNIRSEATTRSGMSPSMAAPVKARAAGVAPMNSGEEFRASAWLAIGLGLKSNTARLDQNDDGNTACWVAPPSQASFQTMNPSVDARARAIEKK